MLADSASNMIAPATPAALTSGAAKAAMLVGKDRAADSVDSAASLDVEQSPIPVAKAMEPPHSVKKDPKPYCIIEYQLINQNDFNIKLILKKKYFGCNI